MSIQIFKKDIMTQKFAIQKYKIGNVVFIAGRRARLEEDGFWISYRYDTDCLSEDLLDYKVCEKFGNIALERIPTTNQVRQQHLDNYYYYSLIESYNNGETFLDSSIVRPYIIGSSDVGAFAFEIYGDLSQYYDPEKSPKIAIDEAYAIYEENSEDIKKLSLVHQQEKRVWSKQIGRLK